MLLINFQLITQFKSLINIMGCSNNKDPYATIVQKYGQQTVKEFIVAMSKVQFIEANRDEILRSLQQNIQNMGNSLMHQVELLKTEIDKKYEKSLYRIEQANPKAMMAAQKTFKTKIQDLMGYKDVIKKYTQYKEQSKLSLQRQQSHTMSHLTNFFKELEQSQRQDIPQLKKFQALDDDQQQQIVKAGKKKYKSAVKKGLEKIQTLIQEKCNFDNFEPKFNAIVTKQKQNQLLNFAQKVFMAGEEKVKGSSNCKTC